MINALRLLAFLFVWMMVARVRAEEAVPAEPAITAEQEQFFEQHVRPVLATRCFECHGDKKQESGLRLDSRAAILKGGDAGDPAAVVGAPESSPLVAAVRYDDLQMPPDEPLAAEQVEAIVAWVKMGLPWPASPGDPAVPLNDEEHRRLVRETHWSFQPVQRPEPPAVDDHHWGTVPLDRYVLAKLEQRGLSPSVETDRRALIRRATFDLLGLPPSPAEVDAFLDDRSPDAYERLIDRLLSSPRYGERWGRHWLDVARYADTRGYAFNRERRYPYSYTYRDYVIRSLNTDTPYDRFVLEQLAADLLDLDDNRGLAALGFLTVGRKFNNRHDDLDDQIDVVGRGLMGLTVACARCHDHKYDPIPAEDYYSLYGVFASSFEPDDLPLIGVPEETPGYDEFKSKLDELSADRESFLVEQHTKLLDLSRSRVVDYLVRAATAEPDDLLSKLPFLSLGPDDLKPALVQRWRQHLRETLKPDDPVFGPLIELSALPDNGFAERVESVLEKWQSTPPGTEPGQINPRVRETLVDDPPRSKVDAARLYGELLSGVYERLKQSGDIAAARGELPEREQPLAAALFDPESPTDVPRDQIEQYLNRAERNKLTELQKKIDAHQVNSLGSPARAMVLRERPNPHNPRVFLRGSHARPGKPVPRQFLYVVAGDERQAFQQGSGRLELAQSIVDEANPLTRRVIVNRLWMHHFGQPLVETPSDFGIRCPPPEHAELLDYLATLLVDRGWSLKALHREIMLSSTYRQTTADREECRAVDPENRLLWRMNRQRLEFEAVRDAVLWAADKLDLTLYGKPVEMTNPPFQRRRAVYGYIDRQDLPNLFRVFDFASPDQSASERPRTTVPQQALFMMNSPFVIEQAKALAARPEVAGAADSSDRIHGLYRLLMGRHPSGEELDVGRQFIESLDAAPDADAEIKLTAWEQYVQLLLLTNEFVFVD